MHPVRRQALAAQGPGLLAVQSDDALNERTRKVQEVAQQTNAKLGEIIELGADKSVVSALQENVKNTDEATKSLISAARERLVALSCVDGNGTPITPCGRCRQLLAEHAVAPSVDSPGLLIDMDGRDPLPFVELLPHAFGVTNLDAVATSATQLKGES